MSTSADRKNVLKQMKVRTTYRKDKSWIHQSSEDERDETPDPMSPQLKSLEGKKFHWSPTPDSKTERDSGTFTAKEVYASSLSPPVHARNKQNSYSSIETNKSTSTTSQPSPPPSTTGGTKTPSYIIRGQPLNSVSQVKNQYSFNGYQKSYSTAQPRTSSSLPRVPTATGYKMSTEEYKKLAPYNVRSGSVDLSDDELQERPVWTEDNSKVLKATPQRDSSYVTSAAKRSSRASHNVRSGSADLSDDEGLFTQEQSTRSDQSSKVLKTTPPRESSYVTSAAKRSSGASYNVRNRSADPSDDEGIDAQEQSTRTEPTSKVLKSTPPRDSSFVTSSAKRSSGIGTEETSPFVAKRVQIQEEENSPNKKNQTLPKTLSSYLYEDNKTAQIQEEENSPNKKSQTLPKTLSSYLYEDNKKFENNWKDTQSKQTTSQTTPSALVTNRSSSPQLTSYSTSNVVETKNSTVKPEPAKVTFVREESSNSDKSVPKPAAVRELSPVTTRRERVETTKRSDTLPESLASYLYDDVNRYEKGWKSNQSTQSTSKTVTKSGTDRPESPKLTSWSTNTDTKTSIVKPDPGRVTVLRDESGTSHPNIPRLTSSNTETKSSNMQSGPGKIAVLTEGSKDVQDALKLTSSSLPTSAVDSTQPMLQAGPGKVTVIRDKSDVDNGKARSEILTTTTTGRAKITIETITESTPPKPAPRMETKPKEAAAVKTSDKQEDLISWSDLDDNTSTRIAKGRSVSPTPAPIQTYKASEKSTGNPPLSIVTPELKSSRNNQPTKPGSITTVEDTKVNETRYRVPESLDPESYISNNKTNQPTKPGSITTVEDTKVNETRYRVPESIDQEPNISNNKINQPSKPGSITTVEDTKVNETRYRVPESIDQEPNISNNKFASGNKRVTVTTLEPQPERPRTPEQRSSSPRLYMNMPIPRPRESTKTLVPESRYRVSETLEDTMLEASPSRSSSRTTVTTTRSTDPVHTEYTEGADKRSSRTVSSSTEKITTTTTTETQYENSSSAEAGQYDPQSSNNKGVLFVKEYVNSRESLKSPTTSGSFTDFSDDSERVSYSSSSSYLYSSPPDRSDEGPCTYCGRPIKDCPKIILEHLNIYCHEYCFKCGICNKPMGDLVDSLFIHRDVVHCENCYEKLF